MKCECCGINEARTYDWRSSGECLSKYRSCFNCLWLHEKDWWDLRNTEAEKKKEVIQGICSSGFWEQYIIINKEAVKRGRRIVCKK